MALDRQSIEKKDFPIGRRGYDPEAVDAHLRAIADEVEQLKQSTSGRGDSLAAVATEQVRTILESAETAAARLRRQAEEESRDLRERAAALRDRLGAMESELRALIERTPPKSAADQDVEPSAEPEVAAESEVMAEPEAGAKPEVTAEPEVEAEPSVAPETKGEPSPSGGPSDGASDADAARLVALNMALNGSPREETDRYLAENFQLADRGALLDEVYSSVRES